MLQGLGDSRHTVIGLGQTNNAGVPAMQGTGNLLAGADMRRPPAKRLCARAASCRPRDILLATMALNLSADDPPILGVGVVLSFVIEVKKTLRKFTWRG